MMEINCSLVTHSLDLFEFAVLVLTQYAHLIVSS
jgi:hypothetical protein